MNIKQIVLLATTLTLTSTVSATIITYGNLTSDNTTNYIEDMVTGRQYLRFDTFDLTHADTVTATSAGGIYEDWNIATSEVADEFVSAILGTSSTACTGAVAWGTQCGSVAGWTDDAFGTSFNISADRFTYISTQASPGRPAQVLGMTQLYQNGNVFKYDDFFDSADSYNRASGLPINFLLYRDAAVSSVPVPAAAWLFGSGLLGLIGVARRKARD